VGCDLDLLGLSVTNISYYWHQEGDLVVIVSFHPTKYFSVSFLKVLTIIVPFVLLKSHFLYSTMVSVMTGLLISCGSMLLFLLFCYFMLACSCFSVLIFSLREHFEIVNNHNVTDYLPSVFIHLCFLSIMLFTVCIHYDCLKTLWHKLVFHVLMYSLTHFPTLKQDQV